MELQVRRLLFMDLFSTIKILKKIKIKDIIKNQDIIDITKKDEKEKLKITDEKGLEFFIEVILNAGDAEEEIMQLVAKVCNLKLEEVKQWELSMLKEFYTKFMEVNKIGELTSFFSTAISSMK